MHFNTFEFPNSGDFMQRRFTERLVNANVKYCFMIGQCHGNGALLDVGVGDMRLKRPA